jgi:hypothetical protein
MNLGEWSQHSEAKAPGGMEGETLGEGFSSLTHGMRKEDYAAARRTFQWHSAGGECHSPPPGPRTKHYFIYTDIRRGGGGSA